MKNKYSFTISKHFLCAGINADISGLSEEDIKLMGNFDNELIKQHGNAHYIYTDNDLGFCKCEISGLMSTCEEMIILSDNKGETKQ